MIHRWMGRLAAVAALGLVSSIGLGAASAQQQPPPPPPRPQPRAQAQAKNTVVHLTKSTNQDPHAVFMALSLANALQRAGASVTLFLDLEGVRVADTRSPGEFRMVSTSAGELYESFVDAGGRVALCAHCAQAAGIEPNVLRRGAFVPSEPSLARILLSSDQILDY